MKVLFFPQSMRAVSVQKQLRRLLGGFVVLLLCALCLIWANVDSQLHHERIQAQVKDTLDGLSAIESTQNSLLLLRRELVMAAAEQVDPDFSTAVQVAAARDLPPLLAASQHLASHDPRYADAVRRAADTLVQRATDAGRLAGQGRPVPSAVLFKQLLQASVPTEQSLREYFDDLQRSLTESTRLAAEAEVRQQWVSWSAISVLVLFALAGLVFMVRGVFNPLRALSLAMQQIGEGQRLTVPPVHGDNEFARLGHALLEYSSHVGRLNQLAFFDRLTGLPNRTRLIDDLGAMLVPRGQFALAFADIDHFRLLNEGYGHGFGDLLIKMLAQRLQGLLNPQTRLYRYSGDAFALLMPLEGELARDDIHQQCERLRQAMSEVIVLGGHRLALSMSFGIGLYPHDGSSVETLLSAADSAVHAAKSLGRNGVHFARGGHGVRARQRLELAEDLRMALTEGQLEPYFQPIIDLVVGEVKCAEALARWKHPVRGFVSPDVFIGVAEETGQIDTLTQVLLKTACRAAARWPGHGRPPQLAFNLSARQVRPGVVEMVQDALTETGLPAARLEIEITESAIIERPETAERLLRDLRDIGVSVVLDDFGTGYSSLSYLMRFPIDKIKVDRSFIAQLEGQRQAGKIVAATIALAASLEINLVAEGVERVSQMVTLVELGCRQQQGWLFSKALPSEEFVRWMTTAPLRIDAVLRAQADAADGMR
jgi:diguanylate cyclase (GGDEF)-like protein